ncbi:DUF4920 domain-containing protein [Emticicia sp. 21SJ11W-3]|uniref:DUF4920 domain-containing protein n=1 Tax=Emticicia sp. 21SJ11W-3 TaxID=2916755 RepID=UPI00209FE9CB|nr:DUF4920 domain-containing protein [Emticicia sp. 21SJ11W-3]UTA68909.1 DUF4920 domain-containing protein [Emticicia sp. 21SJ11W-3]
MKKLISILAILLAVNVSFGQKYESFGEKINPDGAIATSDLEKKAKVTPAFEGKVTGVVESVCQVKGCWMKVKMDDGQTMRVTFKDYGFFVPKDIAGKTVVFEGNAKTKTTSVDELRHYAEDAGKSKEEVAKITEPKTELTFVANGVLVPKN